MKLNKLLSTVLISSLLAPTIGFAGKHQRQAPMPSKSPLKYIELDGLKGVGLANSDLGAQLLSKELASMDKPEHFPILDQVKINHFNCSLQIKAPKEIGYGYRISNAFKILNPDLKSSDQKPYYKRPGKGKKNPRSSKSAFYSFVKYAEVDYVCYKYEKAIKSLAELKSVHLSHMKYDYYHNVPGTSQKTAIEFGNGNTFLSYSEIQVNNQTVASVNDPSLKKRVIDLFNELGQNSKNQSRFTVSVSHKGDSHHMKIDSKAKKALFEALNLSFALSKASPSFKNFGKTKNPTLLISDIEPLKVDLKKGQIHLDEKPAITVSLTDRKLHPIKTLRIHAQATREDKIVSQRLQEIMDKTQFGKRWTGLTTRPSMLSLLYFFDSDIKYITQLAKETISPLYVEVNLRNHTLTLGHFVRTLIKKMEARLRQTLKAYHFATGNPIKVSTSPLRQGMYNRVEDKEKNAILQELRDQTTRLNNLMIHVTTALNEVDRLGPNVERLSRGGCRTILVLSEKLAMMNNKYFNYLGVVADDRFNTSEYLTLAMKLADILSQRDYRQESPAQFLNNTLDLWQKKCGDLGKGIEENFSKIYLLKE